VAFCKSSPGNGLRDENSFLQLQQIDQTARKLAEWVYGWDGNESKHNSFCAELAPSEHPLTTGGRVLQDDWITFIMKKRRMEIPCDVFVQIDRSLVEVDTVDTERKR
jgi:hypothetical protein